MTYSRADLLKMLDENDKAVCRAVVAIYKNQTESEKVNRQTTENNGVGFNGVDSTFLSSLAEQYEKNKSLSKKQIESARKSIKKYVGQLVEIANQNEENKETLK